MEKRKTLQELTIKDNFMFGVVMADEEVCGKFLEMVLGITITHIEVCREKSLVYHPEYKGVRLDVYARGKDNTHYNIEMQAVCKTELGKRSRYYHSQMDMELLSAGRVYEELPQGYVIFVCDFDPFGYKKYQYTFAQQCREEPGIRGMDGSHTIFLSTKGENAEEVTKELEAFLKYVKANLNESQEKVEDDFVTLLQERVGKIKRDREMEERFMLLEEMLKDERSQGKKEARQEMVMALLRAGVDVKVIQQASGVSEEELEELQRDMGI